MSERLDILAFGAHPDDVELGCGGTLLQHAAQGYTFGIVDLTKGELGTRGTPKIRLEEAKNAAAILGCSVRENLGMADGFFRNDEEHKRAIIEVIRAYKPTLVLANAIDDRHPDHGRAAQLVREAAFLAGLRRIETRRQGKVQEPHRPKNVYHYIQAYDIQPDMVVDISPYFSTKMDSIKAHASQFYNPDSDEPNTFISGKNFLQFVESRNRHWGKIIDVDFAEGFTAPRFIGVPNLIELG